MQQAVLCYFNSTQISQLLCLHSRGVHFEVDVYSFKELSCSGPDTAGVKLSCVCAVSVWRILQIQRLFSSRFYTSVFLFLRMSGTPVPYRHICMSGTPASYRHFCIYQAHQCLRDISAYVRPTSALDTFLHMSVIPVPYRHFCICQSYHCLTDVSAYVRHTNALQTFLLMSGTPVPYRHFCLCEAQCVLQTFLHMSGTPVSYRHFCICRAHQCLTDITFVSVLQLTQHNVAKVSV